MSRRRGFCEIVFESRMPYFICHITYEIWHMKYPRLGQRPYYLASAHRLISHAFDDGRYRLAASDAARDQCCAQASAFEFVKPRPEDHRAGRAQRVSERDSAAVDVDLFWVDAEVAHGLHRHDGEGLVDLPEGD